MIHATLPCVDLDERSTAPRRENKICASHRRFDSWIYFTCRHTCPKKKAITAVMFSVFCTAYTFTTHASDPRRAGKTSEPAHFQQTVLNVAPSVWRRISPLAYLFSQKQTIFAQEMAHLKTLSTFRLSKHILEASCCQEARKFWTRTQILHRWGLLVLFNIS